MSVQLAIEALDRIRLKYIDHSGDCSLYVRTSIVEFTNILIWWLRREMVDEFNTLFDGYLARQPRAMNVLVRELYTELNCGSRQELTDFLQVCMRN